MKRASLLFVLLVLANCASKPPERVIIDDAARALGGSDKIQAVNTYVAELTGEQGNLGQHLPPDAPLPIVKATEGKLSVDYGQGRWKTDLTRVPTFVTANTAPQKQIQGLDGNVAYNVAADGMATRASEEVAKDRRMAIYQHPIGMLRTALAPGAQLANLRKEGGDDVVDITTA